MKAITKVLAGGVAIAALASAAPAAAQYYPGYGYGGNVVGQVLQSVIGGGYGGYGNSGVNSQAIVNQCAAAVQQRLSASGYGDYGGGYGGYGAYGGGYGYNGYGSAYGNAGGGARVLGISRVEPRSSGGLTVRGVANSGRSSGYGSGYGGYGSPYGGYGSSYGGQQQVDLVWKCKTDFRGYITDIQVNAAQTNYGYTNNYTPWGNDYSQYGYRRY
jgi:hypothetical protein